MLDNNSKIRKLTSSNSNLKERLRSISFKQGSFKLLEQYFQTFVKPNYHISKPMKYIFVSILKSNKNSITLFSVLYFIIVLVDYVLYYKWYNEQT